MESTAANERDAGKFQLVELSDITENVWASAAEQRRNRNQKQTALVQTMGIEKLRKLSKKYGKARTFASQNLLERLTMVTIGRTSLASVHVAPPRDGWVRRAGFTMHDV
jgi:sulfite reductase beta subunit-like hemoprotein